MGSTHESSASSDAERLPVEAQALHHLGIERVLAAGAVLLVHPPPDLRVVVAGDRIAVDARNRGFEAAAQVLARHEKDRHPERKTDDDEPEKQLEPLLAAHDVEHKASRKTESIARAGVVPEKGQSTFHFETSCFWQVSGSEKCSVPFFMRNRPTTFAGRRNPSPGRLPRAGNLIRHR